jgi:hypothetical protein
LQKIHTIFKRDYSDTFQVLPDINPACQWVFDGLGTPYRKFQGMAALIYQGIYYKRAIIKQDQVMPTAFIPCTYDHQANKSFGWLPVDFNSPQDQYYAEAFDSSLPEGTYELIGPKILGNPEKVDSHKLVSHTVWKVSIPSRTYQEIKAFLTLHDFEGIVFHHPNGKMAKIKKKDFGLERP